jgi:triacylglycerol lipase
MSTFDPRYAHDVLLPLAEAGYVTGTPTGLPANFSVVGPITVDPNHASVIAAAASLAAPAAPVAPEVKWVARMIASGGRGFGWLFQNTQDHVVVISFRGTVSPDDRLHDFDALPTAYAPIPNYGTVHKGFQEVYMVVRDSVFAQLQAANQGYTRLVVIGHSLGAAVSELAAPDLLRNAGVKVEPEVQNFAGPRVGHHDFSSIFDVEIDTCFRVVNIWDIVPHVPPTLALFEHVGLAVRVDGGFTLDELVAHSMPKSYDPGLAKLIPPPGQQLALKAAATAVASFPSEMAIGREA